MKLNIVSVPRNKRSAFTLLEIMLVVSIIGLLLAAGIHLTRGQLEGARETRVYADIQAISVQLKLFEATNGFFPSSEQGLMALVERPASNPKPRQWRQLLERVPLDPWQNEYVYVRPGKKNSNGFDLYSKGPDATANTEDDIGNWEK